MIGNFITIKCLASDLLTLLFVNGIEINWHNIMKHCDSVLELMAGISSSIMPGITTRFTVKFNNYLLACDLVTLAFVTRISSGLRFHLSLALCFAFILLGFYSSS